MTEHESTPLTRAQRRRRSEEAILAAAKAVFAERGFDRTTIRVIADRAGVDPALVMQHFSSKERLFAAALASTTPLDALVIAHRQDLPAAVLDHALAAFEDPDRRTDTEALLRSSLTHPAALAILRGQVLVPGQARVAETIATHDADLRAALLNACMLGVTISRYLLEVPALTDAKTSDLRRTLLPALDAIINDTE